jgi:hypothetical protein
VLFIYARALIAEKKVSDQGEKKYVLVNMLIHCKN